MKMKLYICNLFLKIYIFSKSIGMGLWATDSTEKSESTETDLWNVGFGIFMGFVDQRKHIQ